MIHEVIPAILAKTKEELEAQIRRVEKHVQRVHIDIADGKFVPNTTIIGYDEMDQIRTDLRFGVHLMIENPNSQMYNWYKVGGIERILIHIECRNGLRDLLEQIKLNNIETGLVFNPMTRPEEAREFIEDGLVDMVQIMTVDPGFQGAPFLSNVLYKIGEIKERYFDMPIAVDGGMTPETAKDALRAGATVIVAGSYIKNAANAEEAIQKLKEL